MAVLLLVEFGILLVAIGVLVVAALHHRNEEKKRVSRRLASNAVIATAEDIVYRAYCKLRGEVS